jgi:DNA-binding HxlR family transcriptional regulator
MGAVEPTAPLERSILMHLLAYRGGQVRFEADQRTTEFGILRAFEREDSTQLRTTLRQLEMRRLVYRRMQYVIGYSEPKLVYSLTPMGQRLALDLSKSQGFQAAPPDPTEPFGSDPPDPTPGGISPGPAGSG